MRAQAWQASQGDRDRTARYASKANFLPRLAVKKIILLSALLLSIGLAVSSRGFGWALVDGKIRHDFPAVRRISTAELAAWLSDRERPAPLLLDVRTPTEYEVSHLAGARQVHPAAPASVVGGKKDEPIVTYCSVGYRSGSFAEKLRAAGYTNVVNLQGSIFRWANEGRPLVRNGEATAKVHPYNRTWGLLLKKKYRAEIPAMKENEP